MSIRDDVKANMKTEEQVLKEKLRAEEKRIEMIKNRHLEGFKNAIISESKKGIKGNVITGNYVLSRLGTDYLHGKRTGIMFLKRTLWKFKVNESQDAKIGFDAITKYALEENIAIKIDLVLDDEIYEYRKFETDYSAFPWISILCDGYDIKNARDRLSLANFNWVVRFSLTL